MPIKTATLLFGLASAAATPGAAHHPLCHSDGSPACGNIGQAGRPERAPAAALPMVEALTAAPVAVVRLVPMMTRMLVRASSSLALTSPTRTPLLTQGENIACGNVMTKGGPQRKCHPTSTVTAAADSAGEEP